jgi:predicted ribosomally synthesized peptide with SipW-like signal peptide
MGDKKRKILLTLLIVGVLGSLAAFGTYAAFSSTTSNPGNSYDAGTVVLSDNDANAAMYTVTGAKPGVNTVKCIKLTYTGSLDATVKLYTTSTINASASAINLTVDKGTSDTSTFPNCGTFTSEATIYSGTLKDFGDTKTSFANGISAFPAATTKWVTNDTLVYRFTLSVSDSGSGATSGTHSFTWEAQNQ